MIHIMRHLFSTGEPLVKSEIAPVTKVDWVSVTLNSL